jgi:hypothetical protein
MRDAFSLLLILHGIAHLRGFLVPWRLSARTEMPYTTALLGGTADLGDVGIRIVGLLWFFASIAFVVSGAATFLQDSAWWIIAITATLGSLHSRCSGGLNRERALRSTSCCWCTSCGKQGRH